MFIANRFVVMPVSFASLLLAHCTVPKGYSGASSSSQTEGGDPLLPNQHKTPVHFPSGSASVDGGGADAGVGLVVQDGGLGASGGGNLPLNPGLDGSVGTPQVDAGAGHCTSTANACSRYVFRQLAPGDSSTCGILMDGSLLCWGSNASGQLDAPIGTFSKVATHREHACAIGVDHTLQCWGSNGSSQADPPAGAWSDVSLGLLDSCAVARTDQSITCWGSTWGTPPSGAFTSISKGAYHGCGLKTDETVACWGDDTYGSVSNAPVGSFVAVSSGRYHNCAIRKSDSTVVCWGDDYHGRATAPSVTPFLAVAAGATYSCGLRSDQTIECWGDPVNPPTGMFDTLTSAANHVCGIRADQSVECWGDDTDGQRDVPSP